MQYCAPVRAQVPVNYLIRDIPSFTPGGLALGVTVSAAAPGGSVVEVARWYPDGRHERLAARIFDYEGSVVGNDAGLVVVGGSLNGSGVPHPLAIVVGAVQDLGGMFPGRARVTRMNASGSFVGWADTPTGPRAYVATTGGMSYVPTPGPAVASSAVGITDAGVIIGNWQPTGGGLLRGFVHRGGVSEDLRELIPVAVNESLVALGKSSGTDNYGTFDLRQSPPVWQPLAYPANCTVAQFNGIDDFGQVMASAGNITTPLTGYLYDGGRPRYIDDVLAMPGVGGRFSAIGRGGCLAGVASLGHFLVYPGAQPVVAARPRIDLASRPQRR